MPSRSWSNVLRVPAVAALFFGMPLAAAVGAFPKFETLLPAETRLFVACRNVAEAEAAQATTKLDGFFKDETWKPFFDDVRKEIEARLTEAESAVGLRLVDLKGLTSGQAALAVVALGDKTGSALLVDVTGHEQQLAVVRQKVAASMAQRNAQAAPQPAGVGVGGTHYTVPPKKAGRPVVHAVDALHAGPNGSLWIVADCEEIVQAIGAAAAAGGNGAFAQQPAFKTLLDHTKPPAGEPASHFVAFVDPLGLAAALRFYEHPKRRYKPDPIAVFHNAGFNGLKGIGGQATLGVGTMGIKLRTAALAPPPLEKSLKMLTFVPGPDFAPQAWVAADVIGYATAYWDIEQAFHNFGPLFGGFLEEEETIWAEVIKSLKDDPDGPQVDITDEFVKLLGQRVTAVLDKKLPIGPDSAEFLVAVELKKGADEAETAAIAERVKTTLRKAFVADETVEKLKLDDLEVWKIMAKEEVPEGPQRSEPGVVDGMRTVLTVYTTVWGGHFVIASDETILKKVMTLPPGQAGLSVALDYVAVTAKLGEAIPAEVPTPVALGFIRADELMRIDYELFRAGKMKGSTTLLGRLLDLVLRDPETGAALDRKFTGKNLPPFEQARKYFSPLGLLFSNTPDGLFLIGFTLDDAPQPPAAKP